MKVAFDTSVLVAGLVEAHPVYANAAVWLDALDRKEIHGFWTTHASAETWSVLSRLPLAESMSPSEVGNVVDSLVALCTPVDLTLADYRTASARCARIGVRSGAIFDALHLVAAERARVDALLTLNERDFHRFAPSIRVLAPPATLSLGS